MSAVLQITDGGLIRQRLVVTKFFQQQTIAHIGHGDDSCQSHIKLPPRHGGGTEQHGHEIEHAGIKGGILQTQQMPAGDVSDFMRQHPLDLIGIAGVHQKPTVKKHSLPLSDKGIDAGVVQHHHVDGVPIQPPRLGKRTRPRAESVFNLSITNNANSWR